MVDKQNYCQPEKVSSVYRSSMPGTACFVIHRPEILIKMRVNWAVLNKINHNSCPRHGTISTGIQCLCKFAALGVNQPQSMVC